MNLADQSPELNAIPHNLLREPVEYLYAENLRHMDICRQIKALAADLENSLPNGGIAPETRQHVNNLLAYLKNELPLRMIEKERDIIPRIKFRCQPGDGIQNILENQGTHQNHAESLIAEISWVFKAVLSIPDALAPGQIQESADLFAHFFCAYLEWENTTLLPLAHKRLTPDDQNQIGRILAQRRDIPFPE